MAVIFDEVSADVRPPAANNPQPSGARESGPAELDREALRRELERQAERHARLRAD